MQAMHYKIDLYEISIHAPRTGSDAGDFSSGNKNLISIHAPRTGSDRLCRPDDRYASDFNPRSPHGERPQ